jgi:hypothetical protein
MPNTPQQLGRTLTSSSVDRESDPSNETSPSARDLRRQIDLLFVWHHLNRDSFRAPRTSYMRTRRAVRRVRR